MAELLFEVGTEEIPSNFLPGLLEGLERLAREGLSERRLAPEKLGVLGTPRRLVLWAEGLPERQAPLSRELLGPPANVAFDREGKPTRAAEGFARAQGAKVEELRIKETPKGPYACLLRVDPGAPAREVLSAFLPELIAKLPQPKSMRWGSGSFRFVRPIHWVVALLNDQVIPFELGGVKSGRESRGHRFMDPAIFHVHRLEDYIEKTRQHRVLVDPAERRRRIEEGVREEARKLGGRPVDDPPLLDAVIHLVEWPVAIGGSFEASFLELPREVLIETMRSHQRYFPVEEEGGKLLPHFVAVSNTDPRDRAVVRRGNERVLRARLEDAAYYFRLDRKHRLDHFVGLLKGVVFQAKLGTSYEKVERFGRLALWLADRLHQDDPDYEQIRRHTERAALLAKADLTTGMVGEFPELQGLMGREYARAWGEPEEVANAIYEHHLPRGAGDPVPPRGPGALVGLADRLDTLVGYLGLGMAPTGSEDPYGLRRLARAIFVILVEDDYRLNLREAVRKAAEGLAGKLEVFTGSGSTEALAGLAFAFLRGRLQAHFLAEGFRPDLVDAVLGAESEDVVGAKKRLEALTTLARSPEFDDFALTLRRGMNIVAKFWDFVREKNRGRRLGPTFGTIYIGSDKGEGEDRPLATAPATTVLDFDESRFKSKKEEQDLYEAYVEVISKIRDMIDAEGFLEALNELTRLRPKVDAFFDAVLVDDPHDEAGKQDRLNFLWDFFWPVFKIADFRKVKFELEMPPGRTGVEGG